MRLKIKRVYEQPAEEDGTRVLIDRLWPRGISKEAAKIDRWIRDIAPSTELRKFFEHDPDRWKEFSERYRKELEENPIVREVARLSSNGPVTLLYAAKDQEHNNALVLRDYLENIYKDDDS